MGFIAQPKLSNGVYFGVYFSSSQQPILPTTLIEKRSDSAIG